MNALTPKKVEIKYVIYAYGLFALLLVVLGGIANLLLNGTPLVMKWLMAITAWTPTYVLLLMFPKLLPKSSIKNFYKEAFSARLNFRLLAVTTVLQVGVFSLSVYLAFIQRGVATVNPVNTSARFIYPTIFFTLIQGPMGEESGWRGYLLPKIVNRIGVVKGSLLTSVIWAFWHAPVWFLGTDYHGWELARYIVMFVICITSLGFVISICYLHCKNLLAPIWLHFLFNFMSTIYVGSMVNLVTWYAVLYTVVALGFFFWHERSCKRQNSATANSRNWSIIHQKAGNKS